MTNFSVLENQLEIRFRNKDLLTQAFCHRSYINEHSDFRIGHNERLEFLGDAVLEVAVSQYIYKHYPATEEGTLTSWRAALVNSKMLYKVAKEIEFDKFILLSKGEKKETGKARQEILANAFEAFIGALYLDQGQRACQEFVEKYLMSKLPAILEAQEFIDAKSRFQELAQEREKITPNYEIIREWGPDHAKKFVAGLFIGKKLIAKGEGASKQEAEESAAKAALMKREWN